MKPTRFAALLSLPLFMAAPAGAAPHGFDLAQHLPPHLSVIFTVAWFGVGPGDPQGAVDPGYGNWKVDFPACGLVTAPASCADFPGAGLQRSIASRRRPLAGIYSSSGRDDESRARIDLMLASGRRPCDPGARIDAWAIQLDSVKFTSRYPQNQQSVTWDLPYRALVAFLARAETAGLEGVVAVANDATVYWHFGDGFGLTTQDARKAALMDDISDMARMAAASPAALKIGGRPLLVFYVDAALMTAAEWQTVLEGARAASGVDFYTLATTLLSSYFGAFDGLAPWLNLGLWQSAQGATLRERAAAWARAEHAQLLADVASYPGRVVFGGLTPGFDDATEDWGACVMRQIPRDPELLEGQIDALAAAGVRPVVLETWDDWTEGSEVEPDVTEGAAKLLAVRRGLGRLGGEPDDPTGEAALSSRWLGFGQPRNCCFAGGACPDAGLIPSPRCPPPPDGGALADAAAPADAAPSDAPSPGMATAEAGCGCAVAARPPAQVGPLLLLLLSYRKRSTSSRSCRSRAP